MHISVKSVQGELLGELYQLFKLNKLTLKTDLLLLFNIIKKISKNKFDRLVKMHLLASNL
jgi:hypothetical protein